MQWRARNPECKRVAWPDPLLPCPHDHRTPRRRFRRPRALATPVGLLAAGGDDGARSLRVRLLAAGMSQGLRHRYSHLLPFSLPARPRAWRRGARRSSHGLAAVVTVIVVLSHIVLDAVSGQKAVWDGSPPGLNVQRYVQLEFVIEARAWLVGLARAAPLAVAHLAGAPQRARGAAGIRGRLPGVDAGAAAVRDALLGLAARVVLGGAATPPAGRLASDAEGTRTPKPFGARS